MTFSPVTVNMSFDDYRAAPGISQSLLKIMIDKTPAHLKAALLRANEHEDEFEPAKTLGRLVHAAILEPEGFRKTFDADFAVKPHDMSFATKAGKFWKLKHFDKTIVNQSEHDFLFGAGERILEHPFAHRLFESGDPEVSVFTADPGTQIAVKARFDFNPEGDVIPDLKSCESASEWGFRKVTRRYGYHYQAAWYLKLAELVGLEKKHFVFVAIEKTPPFEVNCLTIGGPTLARARAELDSALQRFAQHETTGLWPGYGEGVSVIDLEERT